MCIGNEGFVCMRGMLCKEIEDFVYMRNKFTQSTKVEDQNFEESVELMDYQEQLKDPKWKTLAEKVKEKANWKCQECGRSDQPLCVHHVKYVSGRLAWQYNVEMLECLCRECHEYLHEEKIANEEFYDLVTKQICPRCGMRLIEDYIYEDENGNIIIEEGPGLEILEEDKETLTFCFTKIFCDYCHTSQSQE